MRRGFERDLQRRLAGVRAPDEAGAAVRARRQVLEAHAAAAPVRSRTWRRRAGAALLAAVLIGCGLTAPGAAVGDWIRDVVKPKPAARPAPAATPPVSGRLLVARGARVGLSADGRAPGRIGHYREATWSPGGRFAAVTTAHSLLAVTPHGGIRWRVTPAAPPRHTRWSPDGFRLAYLSGSQLRVVVGDGSDDRLFRGHVEDVAPAFEPGAGHTVAWVDGDRHVRVADVDLAVLRWRSPRAVPPGTTALSWSPDGHRLLVAGRHEVVVFDVAANRVDRTATRARVVAAAFPPHGAGSPALVERRGGRSQLRLLGHRRPLLQTPGAYRGLVWSPDGRWMLTGWASQWILIRADGRRIVTTTSRGRPLGWTR